MNQAIKRFYFVDESGVDPKSEWFFVGIVVTPREYQQLELAVEGYEIASQKRRKWKQVRPEQRRRFMRLIIDDDRFKGVLLYTRAMKPAKAAYDKLTALSIAKIIEQTRDESQSSSEVYVDGLSITKQQEYGKLIRGHGIKDVRVHRATDHASAMIRLADALAGLVRDATEEADGEEAGLLARGKRNGTIIESK